MHMSVKNLTECSFEHYGHTVHHSAYFKIFEDAYLATFCEPNCK